MIHDALRLVRAFHNLKQKELADALKLSPSYVNEIEHGKKQVTIETLQKYSNYFQIPLSSLLYFAEHTIKGIERNRDANPIATKALKMLDWIEAITRENEDEDKVSA
jgi:transcriptional regulator with XRE-family HTH domain